MCANCGNLSKPACDTDPDCEYHCCDGEHDCTLEHGADLFDESPRGDELDDER